MVYDVQRLNRLTREASENDRDEARDLVEELKKTIIRGAADPQGTMGTRYRKILTALEATVDRLGYTFKFPHTSLSAFVETEPDVGGTALVRKAALDRSFGPLLTFLDGPDGLQLLEPIDPPAPLGWERVDGELEELRRLAVSAQTPHDWGAVGRLCREILVSVADAGYDADLHGPLPEVAQGAGGGNATRRLEAVLDSAKEELGDLASIAKKTLRVANRIQHHKSAGSLEGRVCADATVFVATTIRRVAVAKAAS